MTTQEISTQESSFSRILVAVDYLDSTSEIFQQACDLAQKYKSKLMIFHCVSGNVPRVGDFVAASSIYTYGGVYATNMARLEEELEKETTAELNQWLKSFCKQAEELGIEAECAYSTGEAGVQICARAKEWNANLIILGRRGRTGLSEILLGSVSNYVVHHANCSVLVVQH